MSEGVLLMYEPSLRYTRGLGWRIHCGVEVTESSTNKQHMIKYVLRRLHLFHLHCYNMCWIWLPSAAARACIVVPGSWSPRYEVLVSPTATCIGVPVLRLQSYHHHMCHSSFVLVCPYWDYNHITINIHHTIIPLSYTGAKSLGFRLSGSGFTM